MTNDAPHSAPTPLSRFLGGWMRHASPQEPEQVVDDADVGASDVEGAAEPAEEGVAEASEDGAADAEEEVSEEASGAA